jgi:hypothetical protein
MQVPATPSTTHVGADEPELELPLLDALVDGAPTVSAASAFASPLN